MNKKYFIYLAITAVVGTLFLGYALRPMPSLLTTAGSAGTELSLAEHSLAFTAPRTSTVLEAMDVLADEEKLSFSGKEYPALGLFVEEINGKRNADGFYWILYVNGTSSNTGVSQTELRAGDAVEWRYERGY